MRIEASLRQTVPSPQEQELAVVVFGLRDARRRGGDDGEPVTASRRAAERVVLRPIIASRQGALVAPRGDWLLAAFFSVGAAADAVVAIHHTLLAPFDPTLRRRPLSLRAAIDLAPLERGDTGAERDAFDGAYRLAASAEPGDLLLSSRALHRLGGAVPVASSPSTAGAVAAGAIHPAEGAAASAG